MRFLLLTILACGMARFAHAVPTQVPEIDPGMASGALAVLAGVGLVIRSRRQK